MRQGQRLMGGRFEIRRVALDEGWTKVAGSDPDNPFLTAAYVTAVARHREPWLLATYADGAESETPEAAAVGYLARGRLERVLDVPSAFPIAGASDVLDRLAEFCRDQRIARLRLNTFGSPAMTAPQLGVEVRSRPRREFVLDLAAVPAGLSTNHRRNIKKAAGAGVAVHRLEDPSAGSIHATLVNASMQRRHRRGEQVRLDADAGQCRRFLEAGAGVIYQSRAGGEVLSSMLVLMAERGAYYHSAGTSAQGMSVGASIFLVAEIAARLRATGVRTFNLGGAGPEEAGLARFKSGFRPRVVESQAAECIMAGGWGRRVLGAARSLRRLAGRRRMRGNNGEGRQGGPRAC